MASQGCGCGNAKYKVVFACSGAADVGAIADQTARRLSLEKTASMCCVAGVGANIPEIMEITRNAERILAIDGCPKDCTKLVLEKAGFSGVKHLQLETIGMMKKESPLTEERLESAINNARLALFT